MHPVNPTGRMSLVVKEFYPRKSYNDTIAAVFATYVPMRHFLFPIMKSTTWRYFTPAEHIKQISVWRTIHDFHVLRFIFKIIYEMKCFHRNYFFPLIASALTTVLWSLMYTTSCFRTRFSLMMTVDGTAEKSGFTENIGLRLNSPGRNFNKELLLCCR